MATTTIPWGDGSGDNIYLTYSSASGNQTVEVTSDANTGAARSKVVAFTSDVGNIIQNLTVSQVSGETPGGGLSDYIQDGLVLHMDGKYGKGDGTWTSVVGSTVFTNYGATFNSDNVQFDGSQEQYLQNTSFTAPASSNTIEVVWDIGQLQDHHFPVFFPKTNGRICFHYNYSRDYIYRSSGATMRSCHRPTATKASFSLSNTALLQNGVAFSSVTSNYATRPSSTYNYIGRGSSGIWATGKVYSIRIYNRQLTVDEALENLAVDNIRFNLGLTLE